MPRGSKKTQGREKEKKKRNGCTDLTSAEAVANVNTNHAVTRSTKSAINDADQQMNAVKRKSFSNDKPKARVKLTVVVVNLVQDSDPNTAIAQFEEDGEMIQMEINDGGALAAEFASEEELNDSNYEQNEQSDDSDKDYETDSDAESGEIDTTQSETETQTEEDEQQIDETDQEVLASPCAKRKKKKSR